jgi:hypothetical protein
LAPLELFAERVGPDVQLTWRPSGASDLRDYAVYRATSSGVTPDPIFYLSSSIDTTTTDSNAPTSDLYYVVAAWDVHDNQSAPSNEATVSGAPTGVEDTPRVSALTLRPNSPNPFATTTSFAIGSPGEAEAAVDVFDVAGRRVRTDRVRMAAGWQELRFDGMDDAGRRLPSGVYFYRVTANRETVVRKIVITR